MTSSTRSTTRPPRIGEDLHRAAARPDLQAEHVAIAELRRRHLLLPIAQRLHRAQRVAQLRRLLEALARRGVDSSASRSVSISSSLRPSSSSRVFATATPYCSSEQISRHARRDAALDVVFEARAGRARR